MKFLNLQIHFSSLYSLKLAFKYAALLTVLCENWKCNWETLATHSSLLIEIYWKSQQLCESHTTPSLMNLTHDFLVSNKFQPIVKGVLENGLLVLFNMNINIFKVNSLFSLYNLFFFLSNHTLYSFLSVFIFQNNSFLELLPAVRQRIIDGFNPKALDIFKREFDFFDKVTSISGVLFPLPKEERRAGIRRYWPNVWRLIFIVDFYVKFSMCLW